MPRLELDVVAATSETRSLRYGLELAFDCLTNDLIAQDREYVQPQRR